MSRTRSRTGWLAALIAILTVASVWWCGHDEEAVPRSRSPRASSSVAASSSGEALEVAGPRIAASGAADAGAERTCVEGRAVDAHGRPVAGAEVIVTTERLAIGRDRRTRERSRADSRGRFTACDAPGMLMLGTYVDVFGAHGAWGRASLDSFARELVVVVGEPTALIVTALDPDARPLAGVRVMVGPYHSAEAPMPDMVGASETLARTGAGGWTTGADGRVEIPIATPAILTIEGRTIEARVDGLLPSRAGPIVVRAGARTEHTLRFARERRITGRVVGEGRPLDGLAVQLIDPEGAHQGALTDAEGRFAFGGLTPRELRLQIRLEGWGTVVRAVGPGNHEIELERGARLDVRATTTPLLARCHRGPLSVSLSDGTFAESRELDSSGEASFEDLPAGEHRVSIMGEPAGESATVVLRAGEARVIELPLPIAASDGVVRIAPSGVVGGLVRLVDSRGTSTFATTVDLTGPEDGCVAVPPGTYDAELRGDGNDEARATLTVTAARSTRWTPRFAPRAREPEPIAAPESTAPSCFPAGFGMVSIGGEAIVAGAPPAELRAWPGDRVIAVGEVQASGGTLDDLIYALFGERGTRVSVELERDGARVLVWLERNRCA